MISFGRGVFLAGCVAAAGLGAVPAQARGLSAGDLVDLPRVGDPQVSPDGARVLYDLRTTDRAADRGRHAIWVVALDGGAAQMQVQSEGATSARWSPGGAIYYLKDGQVWRARVCTSGCADPQATQVTHLPLDVGAFRLAPDGRRIVVSLAVFPDSEEPAATRARLDARAAAKTTGQVFDRLFVRHWDAWADGTRNHLFTLALDTDGRAVGAATPLTPGFDGDVPGKPFGGDEDFSFSPDGRALYFSARVAGRTEPWSTNFDVWRVPADGSGAPVDLTTQNLAWDASPVVSPDGRTLAWRAMARPGFEADRFVVRVRDLATGRTRDLTSRWDRSPGALRWSRDGRTLLATADDAGTARLFAIDPNSGEVAALTPAAEHVGAFDVGPAGVVYTRESFSGPATLALRRRGGASTIALADPGAPQLAGIDLSVAEPYDFTGWNGERVHGWVFKPHGFAPGRKYPVAFLIHGGPQGSWGNAWSYRWNPQVYTGAGYAVVLVDFHGSTGYGQAFTDAISGHWGDRPLEDLQRGWAAALAANPFLDGDRACALGASYGGYMVNWIAGVWNAPWRCLVTHDGVFDDRSMGYSTEELWFSEWEHDHHTPWADPAAYERFNPAVHVAAWIKPQLIIHGGRDYRIPLEQGLGAFDALQRKGVESRLLYFPDENHWVLKPADSLLWHATVLGWLDAHLKT